MKKPDVEIIDYACHAMACALNASLLSPDSRKGVGATVFKNYTGRITGCNFNSKPSHSARYESCVNPKTGMSQEDLMHAEVKAIISASLNGNLDGQRDSIAVTSAPCVRCGGVIAFTKLKHVYYLEPHDELEGIEVLKNDYGIESTCLQEYREYIESLRPFVKERHMYGVTVT